MALMAGRKAMRWEQALGLAEGFSREEEDERLRAIDAALAKARAIAETAPPQDGGGRLRNWKGRLAWGWLGAARMQEVQNQVAAAAGLLDGKALLTVADAATVVAGRCRELQGVTELLGAITSANYEHGSQCDTHYLEFAALLNDEYRELALEDDYPAEAKAYAQLDDVLERMAEIRLAPRVASRNICAVAGGFSSGKSSFLNALMGTEDLLPTRITPTTAIPTFIFNLKDSDQSVNVFNHHGGSVEVAPSMFQKMTHDFKAEYGVQLKRLVERVSIYTPKLAEWNNVALIDTPGYTNPDEADGAGSDEEAALRSIWRSQFLIWVVDCERGTLPEQDVRLLRRFLRRQEPADGEVIYLVLNKADKKPEDQREDILKQVSETARRQEIPCFGVGLYSAHRGEWYGCEGRPFEAFMEAVNGAEAVNIKALQDDVEEVFARYAEYHATERKRLEGTLGLMNRLSLGWTDSGSDAAGLDGERSERPKPKRRRKRTAKKSSPAVDESSLDQGVEGLEGSGLETSLNGHIRALRKTLDQQEKWAKRAVVLKGKFLRAISGFVQEVNALRDVG